MLVIELLTDLYNAGIIFAMTIVIISMENCCKKQFSDFIDTFICGKANTKLVIGVGFNGYLKSYILYLLIPETTMV